MRYGSLTTLAWYHVCIGESADKGVFKDRDKEMAGEILPQKGFFPPLATMEWQEGKDSGKHRQV